jgi:enoyl-CoA hydratase
MRGDRVSLLEQASLTESAALKNEFAHGLRSLRAVPDGVERFRRGAGRRGSFEH